MLGVFPLNIVVLPDESVALHLFEPRYCELFEDHRKGEEFVILFSNKLHKSEYGTIVFIENIVNEFPDGTVDIIVKGKAVVKILEFLEAFPNKLYSGVEVLPVNVDGPISQKLNANFQNYRAYFNKEFKTDKTYYLFEVAGSLSLSQETKNELIQLDSQHAMDTFLINQIRLILKLKEQEGLLNNNYHLN